MEGCGTIKGAYADWTTGKLIVTIEIEAGAAEELAPLKDKPVAVSIKEKRQKRSLDANAYYWVLVGKIAAAIKASTTEVHNSLLCDYGKPLLQNGSVVSVVIRDDIDWKKVEALHLKPTSKTMENARGTLYRVYFVMRGSSTYDTKEMSDLIDGCVSEAKSLGIETLPPGEIERIKSAWANREKAS